MVWTDIQNGTLPDADEVMDNFDVDFKMIAVNTIGQVFIESSQTISNQKQKDLTADVFSDSTGYYNTVDTGTTTMFYDASDFTYSNQVVDTLQSNDRSIDGTTSSTSTWTVTPNENGIYVSRIRCKAQTTGTATITIVQNAVTLVNTTLTISAANTYTNKDLVPGDYSALIDTGSTFDITISKSSLNVNSTGADTTDNVLVTSTDTSTFAGYFQVQQNEPQAKDLKIDLPTFYNSSVSYVGLYLNYYQDDFDKSFLTYSITDGVGTDSGNNVGEIITLSNVTTNPTSITISATADALQRIKGYCLFIIE